MYIYFLLFISVEFFNRILDHAFCFPLLFYNLGYDGVFSMDNKLSNETGLNVKCVVYMESDGIFLFY